MRTLRPLTVRDILISPQAVVCGGCLRAVNLLRCAPNRFNSVLALSTNIPTKSTSSHSRRGSSNDSNNAPRTYTFSVPLTKARPKPDSIISTFQELWNDPRPITSLIATEDRSFVGKRENEKGAKEEIPYCISLATNLRSKTIPFRYYYFPEVVTSGGLPKSEDTWTSAMTFCAEMEAVESVGRVMDWGSSSWSAKEVCDALGSIRAEGEMTVFDTRKGESLFAWPPASKGGIGAVRQSVMEASKGGQREFRVGEVIIPTDIKGCEKEIKLLREQFIYPGVDYRIMTMSDKDGNAIFSTRDLDQSDRSQAKLALRPCGWKLQAQLWQKNGMKTDWPVEVDSGLLSSLSLSRFNTGSALPRVVAAFQRDWVAYTLALVFAITPIPFALVARNAVSLYAIPSASMEPTLLKGDVLLVEKLPRVYDRIERGDIILFRPPQTLRDIVTNSGSQLSSTSLFVKRLVGLPGDTKIKLVGDNDVTVNGSPSVGPDRSLCQDEPLRLIDKLLENGKGKDIAKLGADDVYVLGDCKAVSVDSRVFGVLPKENIVGRPVARIWPLKRFQVSGKL
eukprot:scaffold1889_cov203-Chaetoceros_neogracile.AAC.6